MHRQRGTRLDQHRNRVIDRRQFLQLPTSGGSADTLTAADGQRTFGRPGDLDIAESVGDATTDGLHQRLFCRPMSQQLPVRRIGQPLLLGSGEAALQQRGTASKRSDPLHIDTHLNRAREGQQPDSMAVRKIEAPG